MYREQNVQSVSRSIWSSRFYMQSRLKSFDSVTYWHVHGTSTSAELCSSQYSLLGPLPQIQNHLVGWIRHISIVLVVSTSIFQTSSASSLQVWQVSLPRNLAHSVVYSTQGKNYCACDVTVRKYSRAESDDSTMILHAVVCNRCTLFKLPSPNSSLHSTPKKRAA